MSKQQDEMGVQNHIKLILLSVLFLKQLVKPSSYSQEVQAINQYNPIPDPQELTKQIIKDVTDINGSKFFQNKIKHINKSRQRLQPIFDALFKSFENIEICRDVLHEDIKKIAVEYEYFERNITENNIVNLTMSELVSWSEYMLGKYSPTKKALTIIRKSIQWENLFNKIKNSLSCNLQLSQTQAIMEFYNLIELAQMEAYILEHFALRVLLDQNRNCKNTNSSTVNHYFNLRAKFFLKHAKISLQNATGSIWRCDPENHVKGSTYEDMQNIFQGIALNMRDMQKVARNKPTCQYVPNGVGITPKNYEDKKCFGLIYSCRHIGDTIHVCDSPKETASIRFYDYMEVNKALPQNIDCKIKTKKTEWIFEKSYQQCFCICEKQKGPGQYFYVGESIADVIHNMAVTGLRFTVKGVDTLKIIFLQIQVGKLLPNGKIEENSTTWQPLPSDWNKENAKVTYLKRSINLDTIMVPNKTVLTGVKLQEENGHFTLHINYVEYDITTGKLNLNNSNWLSNKMDPKNRELIRLGNRHISTNSPKPSQVQPSQNAYMKFNYTGISEDAAQTTIPFLDIQDVYSQIATPLCGAGIYYKGQEGYGGFFGPKIVTCDYSHHLITPNYDIMN